MFYHRGRCYACILADVSQLLFFLWQMLLPFFLWQMLLPLLCILLADVIAILLLADVIAIVCVLLVCDRCYCHCGCCFCHLWEGCIILWQMLLQSFVADVIAVLLLLCLWQMLWPLWLMVLPFVRLMWLADVICQGGTWNSLPRWMCSQMLWLCVADGMATEYILFF